jgi:cytochrome c oxidase subunit 4
MTTDAHTEEHDGQHLAPHEHEHPGPGQYVKVALFLAVVTAIEVGAYYVTGIPDAILSASLLVMMVVKFVMVGLWFMHLRFDSPLFRRLFIVGIVLAMAVYAVVLVSFGLLVPDDSVRGGFGPKIGGPAETAIPGSPEGTPGP